jgi:hypothetical protein
MPMWNHADYFILTLWIWLKSSIIWHIKPWSSLEVNWCYGGTRHFHLLIHIFRGILYLDIVFEHSVAIRYFSTVQQFTHITCTWWWPCVVEICRGFARKHGWSGDLKLHLKTNAYTSIYIYIYNNLNKLTPFLEAANCRIFAMLAKLRRWLLDSVLSGGRVIISNASGATIAELM